MQSGGWKTEVGGRRGGGGRSMGVINTTSTPSSHGKMGQEDGIFREGIRTIYPFDYNDFILFTIVDNRVSSSPWNVRPLFKVSKKLCLFSMI